MEADSGSKELSLTCTLTALGAVLSLQDSPVKARPATRRTGTDRRTPRFMGTSGRGSSKGEEGLSKYRPRPRKFQVSRLTVRQLLRAPCWIQEIGRAHV